MCVLCRSTQTHESRVGRARDLRHYFISKSRNGTQRDTSPLVRDAMGTACELCAHLLNRAKREGLKERRYKIRVSTRSARATMDAMDALLSPPPSCLRPLSYSSLSWPHRTHDAASMLLRFHHTLRARAFAATLVTPARAPTRRRRPPRPRRHRHRQWRQARTSGPRAGRS